MEDVKITQNEQPTPQNRFPFVVTTDDLIYELGKNVVDKLNKEKLLEGLLKKKHQVESQVVDVERIKADTKKQILALENSNRRYEENNRSLGDELVKVRQNLVGEVAKNVQLILSLEEARKPKKRKTQKKKDLTIG